MVTSEAETDGWIIKNAEIEIFTTLAHNSSSNQTISSMLAMLKKHRSDIQGFNVYKIAHESFLFQCVINIFAGGVVVLQ